MWENPWFSDVFRSLDMEPKVFLRFHGLQKWNIWLQWVKQTSALQMLLESLILLCSILNTLLHFSILKRNVRSYGQLSVGSVLIPNDKKYGKRRKLRCSSGLYVVIMSRTRFSESTLYSDPNVKEFLAQNRHDIWSLSNSNGLGSKTT